MDKREIGKVREDLAASSLAADLAQEFPHSYAEDEILDIAARLDAASDRADELMREDFASLSEKEQERLIALLGEHGGQSRQWWRDYLLGRG